MQSKKLNVGGQAVIEGVMIRGPSKYTVAVRKGKKIIIKKEKIKQRKGFSKLPVVRGAFNLYDMLVLGTKALMWSAEQQLDKHEKVSGKEIAFSFIFAILFGFALFLALPYFVTNFIGFYEETKPLLFNLTDGVIRIIVFFLYILVISLMKDVRTLFQYHGAEHKAIHCYEKGKKLSTANIKKFSTLHPRCGTSFIMIVLVVAILTFSVLTPAIFMLFPKLLDIPAFPRRVVLILIRFSLLPLIAGISYEFLKFSAKHEHKPFIKFLIFPGLLMQKITTKEPTKRQIEVAIFSLEKLLKIESKK